MAIKRNNSKTIFKDFLEYWYYARYFSDNQKKIIFDSLSVHEQNRLIGSCSDGHWDDVLNRNLLDKEIDEIKKIYKYDLIDIRCKVLSNKSVYVPTSFWQIVLNTFSRYNSKYTSFILGGIIATECEINNNVTLLVSNK